MTSSNTKGTTPICDKSEMVAECCPAIRSMLNRIGDKWSMLIVALISKRSMRFNELRRSIDGISQRMLTRSLRDLERDGLVKRTVTPTTPPSVDYALTPLGQTLMKPVYGFIEWTLEHAAEVEAAQKSFDRKKVK
mgnify:CR=1 FL=1